MRTSEGGEKPVIKTSRTGEKARTDRQKEKDRKIANRAGKREDDKCQTDSDRKADWHWIRAPATLPSLDSQLLLLPSWLP